MRRVFWLLLGAVLVPGALICPSGGLLACLALWLLLPPLSLGAVWLLNRGRLGLQMEAPSLTEKGSPVPLTLRLTRGRFAPGQVSLRLQVENGVTGERREQRLLLTDCRTLEIGSGFCGCLTCTADRLRLWDLCGILSLPLRLRQSQKILVMPRIFPVEVAVDSAPTLSEDCQEYAQDRKGQDRTETYQLRDYVPGDSVSRIHWKLTGKREQPVVREPACPVDRSLLIFVDRCTLGAKPSQADALMEAAASVAQALGEQGLSFRLCWNEETIRRETVNDPELLPEALGALLKSRISREESGTLTYLQTLGAPAAGRLIYFGTRYPEEAFVRAAPCITVVCGETATAEGLADELRILSWS